MAMAAPDSARSAASLGRQSFRDTEKLYDNDPETAKNAPAPYAEGDQPMAMESEVFDKDGAVRVQQRHAVSRHEPDGCWYRFKKGMRSVWMTKHTEDTKYDREMYIRTTLRELIIYIIFLIVLCILTFGMTSSTMYYYTKVMSELFLDSMGENGFEKTFRGITRMDDFWAFAGKEGPLMNGLYWEKWYNNRNITPGQENFIFYENKLLGLPRIRMLRVKNDSCKVPEAFEREIKQCYDTYAESIEDRSPFGIQNGTAVMATVRFALRSHSPAIRNFLLGSYERSELSRWVYRDSKDLDGATYWGLISTYGGGGYYLDLPLTKTQAERDVQILKNHRWIDRGTRVIFIDFSVYNANINLFCVVKLILEFPATGGVIPSHSFRTVKLIRYVTAFDYFVLACEGIFCAFILYYIIEEIIEIVKHRLSYFKFFWNILDVVVILIALCCIGFSIYRAVVVDDKLEDLLDQKNPTYANFEFLSFAQTRFNDAVAVMIFFAWIKIFKYISFNKTMNQLSSTLSRCAKDVGGFAVMFFIFFFAYAQLGYLIFGTQVKDFSTFYDAVFTLLRTILGDFDFHELEQANRVLGPIFFITYVFFVFFVLLNMFLAIINDTYAEVKAELATQKNEFEIADFFKRGYYNMLRKMNLKQDKLVDIQAALHGADINADKQIDFDEWRSHLKMRGFADQEIESMFAKYDLDGDRVLDEEEQRKMEADLQGQHEALNLERHNIMEDGGVQRSARDNFSDFDGDDGVGGPGLRGRRGRGTVSAEEFTVLNRRVDRMEGSIGSVVTKIDAVLNKLEGMERVKMRHREQMAKLMEHTLSGGGSDQEKLGDMTAGMRTELDRFEHDSETSP